MDEPTIGLDPHQILIVRDLIASLRGRMTVIISSHILPEIEMTCDRVLIINQGRVVAQGSPADLRREILGRSTYHLELAGDVADAAAAARRGRAHAANHHAGRAGRRRVSAASRWRPSATTNSAKTLLRALLAQNYRVRSLSRAQPDARGRLSRRHPPQLGRGRPRQGGRRSQKPAARRQRSEVRTQRTNDPPLHIFPVAIGADPEFRHPASDL